MIMNLLIIGIWVAATAIIGTGLYIKEIIEENRKKKTKERLWLI